MVAPYVKIMISRTKHEIWPGCQDAEGRSPSQARRRLCLVGSTVEKKNYGDRGAGLGMVGIGERMFGTRVTNSNLVCLPATRKGPRYTGQ